MTSPNPTRSIKTMRKRIGMQGCDIAPQPRRTRVIDSGAGHGVLLTIASAHGVSPNPRAQASDKPCPSGLWLCFVFAIDNRHRATTLPVTPIYQDEWKGGIQANTRNDTLPINWALTHTVLSLVRPLGLGENHELVSTCQPVAS